MLDFLCTIIGVSVDTILLYFYLNVFEEKLNKLMIGVIYASYCIINIFMNVTGTAFMVKIFINAFSVVLILILGYKEFSRMIAIKSSILYLIGELLVVPIVIINESVYDMEVFYVDSITST